MSQKKNYDLHPSIAISSSQEDCALGWSKIFSKLKQVLPDAGKYVVAFECYPGVAIDRFVQCLQAKFPAADVLEMSTAYKDSSSLKAHFEPSLTEDPVFGVMRRADVGEYFDDARLDELKRRVEQTLGLTFLIGTGTAQACSSEDLLVYAGVTRWELQRRQRNHEIGNLGFDNTDASAAVLYKNAFFLEWRVADAIRHSLFSRVSFFLDMDDEESPSMISGQTMRSAVSMVTHRPFRVEPFFDPGPWGGQWMKQKFGLPDGPSNYAWCFDCVPEENAVSFMFGDRRFKLPAIMLVHEAPEALLGRTVYERFGAEFPIRFDLLDTMDGGNLSLQVHPLTAYIKEHFGMDYTQDESYYILDCKGLSHLYLGLADSVDRDAMRDDLVAAQAGDIEFPAERYTSVWPTKKHDHFSIPAGTIHCSGQDNVVLEISATPYIFTFKLWDWGRLGMDGNPRPIHLNRGLENIQWNRDRSWVKKELMDQVSPVGGGPGWQEERTGLHALEFLETRRTWFTEAVTYDTAGNLHVLNLVEGDAVIVESPNGSWEPYEIHYAETFIVPAAVGRYTIRPLRKAENPLGILQAYVRPS